MGLLDEPIVMPGSWVKMTPAEMTATRRADEELLGVRLEQVRDEEAKVYAQAGMTPPADLAARTP